MSSIDVGVLLQEISPEAPSGENLEYDPLFLEMTQAAVGRPEQEMGEEKVAAEEPNWKEVKKLALELAARTKDLRVGVHLCQALTDTDGLPGLRDGLALLFGYVQQHWESLHPQLEDDGDSTMRMNTLTELDGSTSMAAGEDGDAFLHAIREIPLASSKVAGTVSFRVIQIARGEIAAPEGADPLTEAIINGIFSECELGNLESVTKACAEARALVVELEEEITKRVGVTNAASLPRLPKLLGELHQYLAEQLSARGVVVEGVETAEGADGKEGDANAASGVIRSRDDVVRSLDRISQYYSAHEPSSPIPLLMERAKRLVHANFVDLVKDLAPAGVSEIENLRGRRDGSD
jgi:type VI secretion system protein ImpA